MTSGLTVLLFYALTYLIKTEYDRPVNWRSHTQVRDLQFLFSSNAAGKKENNLPIALFSKLAKNSRDKLFDSLVQKHYNSIYKFCFYRFAQDRFAAEDCTQEVFIVLYKNMDRLENLEKIDGWLYKTADHIVKRAYVKAAREKKKVESIDTDDSHFPYNTMIYEEHYDLAEAVKIDGEKCLAEIFESLTDIDVKIWELYYRQRKSLREVSEALNLSQSAVKSRVSRLKRKIITLAHEIFERQ
jgi:RNA polymerase sigma-70 factor (ECF subfamily)